METKLVAFDADGIRFRAIVGTLGESEKAQDGVGGDLYFAFGSKTYPTQGWFFNTAQWPSPDYYGDKMFRGYNYKPDPYDYLAGYLALATLLGFIGSATPYFELDHTVSYFPKAVRDLFPHFKERGGLAEVLEVFEPLALQAQGAGVKVEITP